ncbi:MAG: hypothetical protein WC685_15405 [Methylobacter sp.]|jgi:hypothetical protein
MKSTKDIAALLVEPACNHNKKEKSGCSKHKPATSAGGGLRDELRGVLSTDFDIHPSLADGHLLTNELLITKCLIVQTLCG